MKRVKMFAVLLTAAGMILCLAGCAVRSHAGPSGLSEITYADSEKYLPGPAELTEAVEHIDIHWPVGSVTVKTCGADAVSLSEESAKELTEDARLRYWLDGTTLHIQFCQAGAWLLDEMEKDLTVLVPEGRTLKEVGVYGLSAGVCLDGIRADSLEISNTSGDMRLVGCAAAEQVSVSTVSGDLEAELTKPLSAFSGSATSGALQISAPAIGRFSSSAVSGSLRLTVAEAPKALNVETTSGDIDLALPEDAGFTLDYEATSGDLSSELPFTTEGGRQIFGDGAGAYAIDAVSGDVRISVRK